ncbi:MAG: hypothetical protein JSS81_01185 [Acidobacteria bacterium]|nr:hypothetical protein [Acidobacteriota bacterium]
MKKSVSFLVIVLITLTAGFAVFSQKSRSLVAKGIVKSPVLPPSDVKLSRAEALTDGRGVLLRWQAETEVRNFGFFVYRQTAKGTTLASPSIVGGAALTMGDQPAAGREYTFYDADGSMSDGYYIESVGLDGRRRTFDVIYPKYAPDLNAIAREALVRPNDKPNPLLTKSLLNLPDDLAALISANALPADINVQRWVAAQPGVKIGVKQEGFYRVTRAQLEAAGFNVSAPGNLWQLYMDGKEQSIIVGAGDSYIEFYGKGIDTPESATKVFYLIVGAQDGKRITTTTLRPLGGNVVNKSYSQAFSRKERQIYISSGILNGDAENFFGSSPIIGSTGTPTPVNLTFTLSGLDTTVPKASLEVGIQGITDTQHQITVKINGEQLDTIVGGGKTLMNGYYQIPRALLVEGTNTLTLTSVGGSGDITLAESIKVGFNRNYLAVGNKLSCYTVNYRSSRLTGFTSPNVRVFDLNFPDNPTVFTNLQIDNNNGVYEVVMPSHRGRAIYAVEDSAVMTPDSVTQNFPSTLATAAHNADLVIITHRDWLTPANDWANYRRGQGMTVEVVDVADIFDEFSYGSTSTAAMTNFLIYAKSNWQTGPNYVLLIGDATYDFRNYENRAFQSFVPTKLVDTVYEETGSDEALCDFNNDGLAELAVGRIPVRDTNTVTLALNKTMTFENTIANGFTRGFLFASDEPNGYDFDGLSHRLADQLPISIPRFFVNKTQVDSRNLLLNNLNQGRYLVNYSGHGSQSVWSATTFFSSTDVPGMSNMPNYSVFTLLTCLNGYYLTPADSLGETLLKSPSGGAVAVWASTGKTTPDVQEVMATRFFSQIAVNPNLVRFGDFIRDAKQNVIGGRDVRLSWTLLGDPTLKMK